MTVSSADVAKGVVISNVSVSGTKVIFRPSIQSGNQSDAGWDGDGDQILCTATIEDASAKKLQRSGLLWIAQR